MLNCGARVVRPVASNYLIWSREHQAWWCADERGYTLEFFEAGHYSKADAERIVARANAYRSMAFEVALLLPGPDTQHVHDDQQ